MPGAGRALGQRHALGDLDDPERRQLAAARVQEVRAERISSSAVAGLATGMRIRAGSGDVAFMRPPPASAQRSTRYGFSSSNSRAWRSTRSSAWVGRDGAVLDDEAADAAEVDRHERGDEGLHLGLRVAGRDDQVVDDPGPHVVREVERGHRVGHLEGRRRRRRARRHRARAGSVPGRPAGRPRRRARGPSPTVAGASIERHWSARVSEPAWNSDRSRSVFTSSGGGSMIRSKPYAGTSWLPWIGEPVLLVAVGEPQDRADDLAEHRAEVGPRVLRVVDLRAEPRLADGEAAGQRRRRHPDVDAEAAESSASSRRASR